MSELQPSVYAFEPDLLPPVFEGAPLPVREFQLATMVNDSLFMRSDSLPEAVVKTGDETLADIVREIEANDEPTAMRDGRVIALIAAMTEENLVESTTLGRWQLAPHMGMLHAVATALSTGLPVSSESLGAAAAFHDEYRERESSKGESYAAPKSDAVVGAIKHTMSGYGSMDFISGEKGTGRYLAYYLYDIDRILYELPVTPEMFKNYTGGEEAWDLVAAYEHLMRQIHATREALLAREPELREHLESVYERVERAD
ncbi:MAG TPA: hypothetical protein VFS14_00920 [Candidatus Saccharimonadales bacterium]|nr:hypothetical protein [Candidatus Saccharimonadales bacterium]